MAHLKTMHHVDGGTIVRCHGGRERCAFGAREVLDTVHHGDCGCFTLCAACRLAEGGLSHLLHVILYGDNYSRLL